MNNRLGNRVSKLFANLHFSKVAVNYLEYQPFDPTAVKRMETSILKLEDRFLFICARQKFHSNHLQELIEISNSLGFRWEKVYEEAKQHNIAPLVYANLAQHCIDKLEIPVEIWTKFKRTYIQNAFIKQNVAATIEKIAVFFAQRSIDVMLIKGAALDFFVYDQPWYTTSADIDIVIGKRKGELSQKNVSEIVTFLESINRGQVQFKKHVEYDFFEHHDFTMNGVLLVNSAQVWRDAKRVQLNGCTISVMTPEDMLLAAAINACRKRFLRLKDLCDIAELIDKYPQLNWNKLTRQAHSYQCDNIVYTSLLVTQATLNCNIPQHVLEDLKPNPVRAFLIRQLVHFMCHYVPLATLSPNSNHNFLGRAPSWSLILTYVTYQWDQIGRKTQEIFRAWQKANNVN